jgi:hypothetical protein
MKQWNDKRIENATVEYKNQAINSTALAALAESLKLITDEFSDIPSVSSASSKMKGRRNNGNTGKNQR